MPLPKMHIPEELVLHILAALPLACAFRCKLVCKRLNRLISSPTFWSLRQRLAPDNTYLVSSEIVNGTLSAFCPTTGLSVSFIAPTWGNDRPILVEASKSGLLLCVFISTLSMPVVWNPLTGWWRKLPQLQGGMIGYGEVVGMIVENNGSESISFKVFAVDIGLINSMDDERKGTALHVFNSVDWKWSSLDIGYIHADSWVFRQRHNDSWVFRQRHNDLVAYFLNCTKERPPHLCTIHFASNQLIESTASSHLHLNTFVVNDSLVVNQSSSGRTRALFLLKTYEEERHEDLVREGHECVVQLLEGEEGDEVGSWAPWTLVSLLPPDSRVIGQSEDGKTLYIGRGVDLLLHDMDSHKEDMQFGRNYFGEDFAFIWTPSASMCSD